MPTIVNNYTDIKLVHHSKIQLKSEMALQDATPSGLAQYFHENYPLHKISDISIHTIHLDICSACNYNCKTCIESKLRENNKILSIQKISKILCELKKSGCQNINFYGGEPTLHPDFSLINDLVQTMGFSSLLVTNGSYLDNHDVLKSIVKSKNLHIRISIDSFDENTHKINHGIKNGEFTKICKSVEAAIKKITESKSQTSFSISCLLHENIIQNYQEFKKSINNWKEIGVVSFHFRPLLDERKKPILDAIKRNAFPLRQLIQEYPNFVIAPEWLIKLINNSCDGIDDHSTIGNTINYDKCYSCFYRMIISPIYSNSNKDKTTIKLYAKNSTQNADIVNDAWISLCSYRRFNEDTGCIYPEDFYEWLSSGRIDLANKINPKYAFCSDILCCRHEPNNQTYSDISSL